MGGVRSRGGRGGGEVGQWVAGQQLVLPGGQNSSQKAQKGPEKTKVSWKNLWLNFGRILQKRGQINFFKEFPSWPNFFHVFARNSFGTWQHWQQHTVHKATAECCPLH
jgi:hypothetical protein